MSVRLARACRYLRVIRSCQRNSSYYAYLGIDYHATDKTIKTAIDQKLQELISSEENSENSLESKKAQVLLRKIEKTLLDPSSRSSYDFENRKLIVPQQDEELENIGEREENIYVYNNAREVVTHVNYSLEEIEAMVEVGQMDEVDKTANTKQQRMMFIAFALPLIFFYFTSVEPERCIFRRRRLTSEEKKIIIEEAAKINAQKSSADFVAPAFIEPAKFVESALPPLEDLKSILRRKALETNSIAF